MPQPQHYPDDPWEISAADFPQQGTPREQLTFLVRWAVLAPSSHNSQPWRFSVRDEEIWVFADKSKWLKVADADERELHISLGCALENLLIAAQYFGYAPTVTYFPDGTDPHCIASIRLPNQRETGGIKSGRFEALTQRHTNHKRFDGRPIPEITQKRLIDDCTEAGIFLLLTSDAEIKRKVDELIGRADAFQFADPAFREELGFWIGQGVFGTPWLMSKLGQLAVTHLEMGKSTARKDSELLMSAPIFALLCSSEDNRLTQVKVGQVFERIYLSATGEGLNIQPISQLCEVPEVKAELAGLILPTPGLHVQQPFRLGHADAEKSHTPRRKVEEVLV